MQWGSFPYRPDSSGEYADTAITPPDQPCQTERHMLLDIPAAWLELLYTPTDGGMTINRAWFTCAGCHAALEAEYDPAINRE